MLLVYMVYGCCSYYCLHFNVCYIATCLVRSLQQCLMLHMYKVSPSQIQGGTKKSLHWHATYFIITQIPLLTYISWQNVHKRKGYTQEGLFFSVSALSLHDYFQTTSENVTGLLDIVFCHFGPISSNRLL